MRDAATRCFYAARRSCTRVAIFAWAMTAMGPVLVAQVDASRRPPDDTAELHLTIPDGSTVEIDGRDQGTKTYFRWPGLAAGKEFNCDVVVRLQGKDGRPRVFERRVQLVAGAAARLPIFSYEATRPELIIQTGHAQTVTAVGFSPDGKLLITGSDDNTAIVWDMKTGQQLRTLQGALEEVESVALSAQPSRAVVNYEKRICVWDVNSGAYTWTIKTAYGTQVSLIPDRQAILVSEEVTEVFDLEKQKSTQTITANQVAGAEYTEVDSQAVSRDGRLVARKVQGWSPNDHGDTLYTNCDIELWSLSPQKRLLTIKTERKDLECLCFSPDGKYVVGGGGDWKADEGFVHIWRVADGGLERKIEKAPAHIRSLSFDAEGRTLMAVNGAQVAPTFWRTPGYEKIDKLIPEKSSARNTSAACFSPDGSQIATGHDDGIVHLWSAADGKLLRSFHRQVSPIVHVECDKQGKWAAICSDSAVSIWDLATPKIANVLPGFRATFSPDSTHVATADWSGAWLWEREGKHLVAALEHRGARGVQFLTDGNDLMLAGSHSISTRSLESDSEDVRVLSTPHIDSVVFSNDGKFALAQSSNSSEQGEAALWDVAAGAFVKKYSIPGFSLGRFRMSSDGGRVAALGVAAPGSPGPSEVYTWEGNRAPNKVVGLRAGDRTTFAVSADWKMLATIETMADGKDQLVLRDADSGEQLHQLTLPGPRAFSPAFSPNNLSVAAIVGDDESSDKVVVWDAATGNVLQSFAIDALQGMPSLVWSPDSQRLAIGGSDRAINRSVLAVWNVQTGKKLTALSGEYASVSHFVWSPDGSQIAGADFSGAVSVWNSTTGNRVAGWLGQRGSIRSIDVSPDGQRLATGGGEYGKAGEVCIWDLGASRILHRLQGNATEIDRVAFSHDGTQLLGGSDNESYNSEAARTETSGSATIIWDARTGQQLRSFEKGHGAQWSPDDRQILTKNGEVLNSRAGEPAYTPLVHRSWLKCMALSDDGRWVVSSAYGKYAALLWDTSTRKAVRALVGHSGPITSVAISPDGLRIATGSEDKTVILWETATGRQLLTLRVTIEPVQQVAFSPDNRTIAVGAHDGVIRFLDVSTGRKLGETPFTEWAFTTLAFRRDGRMLASGHGKGPNFLWDVPSGRKLRALPVTQGITKVVAFSHDGSKVFAGGEFGAATIWNVSTGQAIRTLPVGGIIHGAAFSVDDATIWTANSSGFLTCWDVATGDKRENVIGRDEGLDLLAMDSVGKSFATISGDEIDLWKTSPLRRFHTFRGFNYPENAKFSPNAARVLVAEENGEMMLCNAADGTEVRKLFGHSDDVNDVEFLPDGRHVISGSDDGTAKLWDINTGSTLATFLQFNNSEDWLVFTDEGLFEGSEGARKRTSFRISGSIKAAPLDRFFQDYYRPGLLAELLADQRPVPPGEFANKMSPVVSIKSPINGSEITERQVTIEVEVSDRGGGVKPPWLMQNGARVLASGATRRSGAVMQRSFAVSLVEGENRFEVRSASEDGSWESDPAVLVLQGRSALPQPSVYVVAIGVNHYAEESINLSYAANDAKSIAATFSERGPQLYGKDHVHTTLLTDEAATTEGIRLAIDEVAGKASPQDTLIFFLAGHGMTIGQRYYFLPHEFKSKSERFEDDIREQGFAVDLLGELLTKVPALKRVVVLDTCHAGGALRLSSVARDPFAFRGALERLSHSQGVYTIAAASAGNQAQESKELKHGVLTYALLAGLGAMDDGPLAQQPIKALDEGAVVDVRDWFTYAQDRVPLLTRLYFGQEQFIGFSGEGESFPILPLAP